MTTADVGFDVIPEKNDIGKQIILPAAEADKLADSLTQVLARLVHVQDEIIDALKTAQEAQTINIEMDGGKFGDKK